jgi:hypothetical protein
MIFDLHHPPGPGAILLGPLTGAAELAIASTGAADAIALINACLLPHADSPIKAGNAAMLTISDRDRLMAALYRRSFGGQISGSSACSGCEERFDFDFELDQLLGAVTPDDTPRADGKGWFTQGNMRFRLPTGADELAAQGLPAPDAANIIALRCAPDAPPDARTKIESEVARIAPLVDLTLQAPCPNCGTNNSMTFAAERYFLTALLGERRRLRREIHLLGATYHWPLREITALSRDDRRGFAAQIEQDRDMLRKAGAA